MSSFDPFSPANAFWSLFGFALAPFGAQFLEDTDTAVASPPDRKQNPQWRGEDAKQTNSASVPVMPIGTSPTLKEAPTALRGNRLGSTAPPHWLTQHLEVCNEAQSFKVYIPSI